MGTPLNQVIDEQKLRGGYYTPDVIADFLASWAVRRRSSVVLEPSAGDGSLVTAAASRVGATGSLTAVELFGEEAAKIRARTKSRRVSVVAGDVFEWFAKEGRGASYDAVIGNPPFIRYQHFPEEHRQRAFALMEAEGLHPSRLTNAWVPFVVLATRALRRGGRLALVVPAELLQVAYAGELREYLARKYTRLIIVTFRRLIFEGIQQETVLLLGERGDSTADISFVELDGIDDLKTARIEEARSVRVDLDHAREKWIQYYLSPTELQLVRELEASDAFTTLGSIASVDVGIVTGRNEFFVLSEEEAESRGLIDWCIPLVGRSMQIPGLRFTRAGWRTLAQRGDRCYLLQLGDAEREELTPEAARYVQWGERQGMHRGYKCRIRLPRWWNVPSDWSPDAFLLRQIHDGPRIIHNATDATCTDTIHRVRMTDGVSPATLAAASMNSMTFAFAEIRGRSYGGGVLELEPSEAEGLPFPRLTSELPLKELDGLTRSHKTEAVLQEVDRLVLEPVGLTDRDCKRLRAIWRRLFERRARRR